MRCERPGAPPRRPRARCSRCGECRPTAACATLARGDAPLDGPLRELARLVAVFHTHAHRSARVAAEGSGAALRRRWTANISQTRQYRGSVLDAARFDEAEQRALRFVDGRGPLLEDRIDRNRIVDGHGDLIAEDVFCLDDGPRVLDCLEFDDRLRFVDVIDDVAFLAMDLERLGRPDLASTFLDAYVEFTGDTAPYSLREHYIAYRAFVRAKVACLRHDQGDPAAADTAEQYAALALAHLRSGPYGSPSWVGCPGPARRPSPAGSPTASARCCSPATASARSVPGIDPAASAAAGYGEGLYRPEHTDALYAELVLRAGHPARPRRVRGDRRVVDRRAAPRRRRGTRPPHAQRPRCRAVPGATRDRGHADPHAQRHRLRCDSGDRRGDGGGDGSLAGRRRRVHRNLGGGVAGLGRGGVGARRNSPAVESIEPV